uniref:ATP synthase F0 subunit 8 n=1 Tax=Cazira horvathi TaxID=2575653 RepID=A0A4D6X518_9HEMI|nr:ATP synthase F0 subunit 8 [Cazira horvathi]QCI09881.1 ATP synthase F0 subunit 8 [Cazira horvathi]
MPQMSPLWWEILFILFILSFLTLNTMIYFNQKKFLKPKLIGSVVFKNMNWLW